MGAITIGVIGCGYWGPNLRNFAENEAAELRWICDADDARLAAMGRGYPAAQTTADYQKLLSDPKLDAIAVVTPVAMHFPIAKQALLAGKHLLVEKPLTATAREAEELIDLAERNQRTLMGRSHVRLHWRGAQNERNCQQWRAGPVALFRFCAHQSGIVSAGH